MKIYNSRAEIDAAQKNPPEYINRLSHEPGGHFIQLSFGSLGSMNGSESVARKLSDCTALKVMAYPGVDVKSCSASLLKTAQRELASTGSLMDFHATAASYMPKYGPKERFSDLMEYYKNENYIARESRYIVHNILLPYVRNNCHTNVPAILKGFSMGGHELKMAFTYLIGKLQSEGCSELEIEEVTRKFIVYSAGTSLNWSRQNVLAHLYPIIIHNFAIEDEGVIHLRQTREMLYDHGAFDENRKEEIIIGRTMGDNAREFIVIPPLEKMRITNHDKCHNVNSYGRIIQESPMQRELLINSYEGNSDGVSVALKRMVSNGIRYEVFQESDFRRRLGL